MYEPAMADFFDLDSCDFCGECLALCPEFGGSLPDAKWAIRSLASGLYVREVLEKCSSCMTCNTVCHMGCNPYGLVLFHWFLRARELGYPVRASLVMPLEPGNAWHNVMSNLPADEIASLRKWGDIDRPELRGTALFAGCNLQILPYMAASKLFEGLEVFGSPELCCGEVYYRMGALDKVKQVAENLSRVYSRLEITELVAYCQACYNILKNVLPSYFDASFPFEISYFGDLVARRVLSGELGVKDRLKGMRVTLHDPCHSKLLGAEFQSTPRRLLEYMGCQVLEMRHSHFSALCCGLGHGAARHNPLDMYSGTYRRLREARSTNAEALVVYCNSCDLLFSVGTQVTPHVIPVRHINELISEAMEEDLPHRNLARARSMISELFVKGGPSIVSKRRFRPVP